MAQRSLPEKAAQGRRVAAAIAAAISPPLMLSFRDMPPHVPLLRDASSNSNLTVPVNGPQSSAQVIALAREAMRLALQENEAQAADATGLTNDHKPGVTIDLSRKNIWRIPEEVVDIIKHDLERLALSHNHLQSFPNRFSECASLRYLNVRQNKIKDFPLSLCDLRCLEILDLGRNRLTLLPPDIVKLSCLKVLALQKNQIAELPLYLADMPSLQMLKLEGNPLIFPPPEVMQVRASTPPNEGFLRESEVTQVALTAHIKRYLKQQSESLNGGHSEGDVPVEEPREASETLRLPIRRVVSGRFPVKVNGTELPDLRSPNSAVARPPPIPSRSHYRVQSQQNAATRAPGVVPLAIGSTNERIRSNSETVLSAKAERVTERPESRSRRMGIVSRKTMELGTLDETQVKNRFSHYRGLSHGSALQGNGGINVATDPPSPVDPASLRRLEPNDSDPALDHAKGILHSVSLVHPTIKKLLDLAHEGTEEHPTHERILDNTDTHIQELGLEIKRRELVGRHPDSQDTGVEKVQRASVSLLKAYGQLFLLLKKNTTLFVDYSDPRFMRTFLSQLYNGIMEFRATFIRFRPRNGHGPAVTQAAMGDRDMVLARSGEDSFTPTTDGSAFIRGGSGKFVHNPSHLRVATDMTGMSFPSAISTARTATIPSATPRSGESFTSTCTGRLGGDFSEEDRMFENIFLSLQRSTELVMGTLPILRGQFIFFLHEAAVRSHKDHVDCWSALVAKCSALIQHTEMLKAKLSSIKFKEPGIRTNFTFWALCNGHIEAWYELIQQMKLFPTELPMPMDIKNRLRPIQQSMKQAWDRVRYSPWARLAIPDGALNNDVVGPCMAGANGPAIPAPPPMTPQSAALGPAVQATVPSTPQSASFAAAFSGNVFERADALISLGGISMASRTGTMTSTSTASFTSFNSAPSSQNGDANAVMGPVPTLAPAPAPLSHLPFRPSPGNHGSNGYNGSNGTNGYNSTKYGGF